MVCAERSYLEFMATYFQRGAAMSDCLISSLASIAFISVSDSNLTTTSSVSSKCWPAIFSTSVARNVYERLVIVPGLAERTVKSFQLPFPYPVSSRSSRCAAWSGVSPFSATPATSSVKHLQARDDTVPPSQTYPRRLSRLHLPMSGTPTHNIQG